MKIQKLEAIVTVSEVQTASLTTANLHEFVKFFAKFAPTAVMPWCWPAW